MGKVGEGTIEFLVKTTFGGALSPLTLPHKVTPSDVTEIAYVTNTTELETAVLRYTIDSWKNVTRVEMVASTMTCNATIPQQTVGSVVGYTVQATDTIKNTLEAAGNFTVKHTSAITDFNATRMTVTLGENITITGTLSAEAGGVPVTVTFISVNTTETVQRTALGNGTFTASFQPETTGTWIFQATFAGNSSVYECESTIVQVTVEEQSPLLMYGLRGGGVGGGLAAVGAVIYVKKYRE